MVNYHIINNKNNEKCVPHLKSNSFVNISKRVLYGYLQVVLEEKPSV